MLTFVIADIKNNVLFPALNYTEYKITCVIYYFSLTYWKEFIFVLLEVLRSFQIILIIGTADFLGF